MPPITVYPGELWGRTQMPDIIDVDFLMPNGFLITLKCSRETTLADAKENLWKEAENKFQTNLKAKSKYVLISVTQDARTVEYYDENKRICDLKLFHPFFKLIDNDGENIEEKTFNSEVCKAIGLYSNEIENLNDDEIRNYRYKLLKYLNDYKAREQKETREQLKQQKIEYLYTQNVIMDPDLLDSVQHQNNNNNRNKNSNISINIHVDETNMPRKTYKLNVSLKSTPLDIICSVIRVKLQGNKQYSEAQILEVINRYKDSYLLNICGLDEILFGNKCEIGSYKYVKSCLNDNKSPNFYLISLEKIVKKIPKENLFLRTFMQTQFQKHEEYEKNFKLESPLNLNNTEISWNIEKNFAFYIKNASFLPSLKDCEKLSFKIGLYHGQELLGPIKSTKYVDYQSPKWFETIEFTNLNIKDIHRCTKLCIGLYSLSKRKKESFPLGFISLNLFDYKGYMLYGKKTLHLWPILDSSSFKHLSISQVTGQYPNKNNICVDIEFPSYLPYSTIIYPSTELIRSFIKHTPDKIQDDCIDIDDVFQNDNFTQNLSNILNKDAIAELTEQDKSVLWKRRYDCINYPNSLSKLLQSVHWPDKDEVIEVYKLLSKWPVIKPAVAIELLHSIYADTEVRNFAVKCLEATMKDEEVQQYLLQLVQALKNEPYYENNLTKFLLNRAFKSQRIGFDLFWLLKTEMKNPKYKYRFGLILEAYCRGIASSIKDLLKQIDVIDKLSVLMERIKENREDLTILKGPFLQETLEKPDYKDTLSNLISPLNRSHLLGTIEPTRCKILTSAKRPLYLTWTNACDYADVYDTHFEVIFKQGDDLRQDMLTLQILRLMDLIWKSEGFDLKMLIYQVFTTGSFIGFIEVMKNSMTLFKIQMAGGIKGRYQIDTLQLYKWICANNPNEKLDIAIDLFTRSCAAYCVATFILGIGDRHPDNIMVSKEGHLFHIDYGHFLGNFKKKYGIKRERVPFVLTEDFTRVISRGASNPEQTPEFEKFRVLCENSYMIIRRHSHTIINLFLLMLSSDMPELQSIADIMYLRKTLAVDLNDDAAREYFRKQFYESYRMSYTTKLDWMCHALNKKNLIK